MEKGDDKCPPPSFTTSSWVTLLRSNWLWPSRLINEHLVWDPPITVSAASAAATGSLDVIWEAGEEKWQLLPTGWCWPPTDTHTHTVSERIAFQSRCSLHQATAHGAAHTAHTHRHCFIFFVWPSTSLHAEESIPQKIQKKTPFLTSCLWCLVTEIVLVSLCWYSVTCIRLLLLVQRWKVTSQNKITVLLNLHLCGVEGKHCTHRDL